MHILVTGANGLIGSRVVARLGARGHTVVALGRGPRRLAAGDYRSVDLTDESALVATVKAANPEIVINPGSMTDVDGCETAASEAFKVNGVAPGVLASCCSDVGAHLVHVSTDYVFDGEAGPYTEDDIPNPRGVYALTKHIGEQGVRALARSWTIARTAVVYGWPPAGRPNFGSWLLGALRKGEPIRLFEDQSVSPSLASSVADQLVELAENRHQGIWNVSGAAVVNRLQFGRALCAEFGLDARSIVPSKLSEAKLKSPRPQRGGLLVAKATAQLANQPLDLSAALARFHREVEADQGAT